MRIQKIDTTPFGYNKKLNMQLEKKIDKAIVAEDFVPVIIKDLNKYCNNTEDKLEISVKNKSKDESLLLAAFLPAKLALAELVERFFPELDYIRRESATYESEGGKHITNRGARYPWQIQIARELKLNGLVTIFEEPEDMEEPEKSDLTEQDEKKLQIKEALDRMNNAARKNSITNQPHSNEKQEEASEFLELYKPSEFSSKNLDSLGGMKDLKNELIDKVIYPNTHPKEAALDFVEYGKRAPRGILLYGPPGCGKTSITEALSQEAKLPLFKLKISKAGSSYMNKTSNNYQKAFDYVAECAKLIKTPCFVLIDEIDGFTKDRDQNSTSEDLKQMGTLLNLIETARDRNIIVIGATNKYDIVDEAMKRRFDEQIYVGMPDMETREEVLIKTLNKWSKGVQLACKKDDIKEIVSMLNGYPTSAIVIIADKASSHARKDNRRDITKEDFFIEIGNNKNLKIIEKNYKTLKDTNSIGYKKD